MAQMTRLKVMALLCVVALLAFQTTVQGAFDAAKPTMPEGRWSARLGFRGAGTLIIASREYDYYPHGIGGSQGPSPPGTKMEPPPLFLTLTSVEQVFLLPLKASPTAVLPWPDQRNEHPVYESDLGEGHGFHWYGKASLDFLLKVRKTADLRGGEDPHALCMRVLATEKSDFHSLGVASETLERDGDLSLPVIREAIASKNGELRRMAISVLARIRSEQAVKELLALHQNAADPQDRARVLESAYRLPYLADLQPIYAECLSQNHSLREVAGASRQFGWKEFVPGLQTAFASCKFLDDAFALYQAIDFLAERSHPQRTLDALAHVRAAKWNDSDIQALTEEPDKTFLALQCLTWIQFETKIRTNFPALGLRILDTIPASVAAPLVERFKMQTRIDRVRQEADQ